LRSVLVGSLSHAPDPDPAHQRLSPFKATIHQSIPSHPNIVTLYQTFQTSEWLFLVMELCPGEDLFYWLEHSKPPSTDGKLPTPFQHSVAMTPVKQQMHQLMGTPPSQQQQQQLAGSGPHHNNPAPHHGSAPHVSHLSNHLMSALAITPQNKTHGTPSNSFLHSTLHSTNVSAAYTPPTPSLLSAVPAPLLLSPSRVRLIASMFAQMCAAVQACHDAGVSHRDIKPENVIVTEEKSWRKSRGKVVCKLTDFGLATRDEESEDVECGSRRAYHSERLFLARSLTLRPPAPAAYMAVECRNNLGPSYRPPPADVWSLGIVLINMVRA
jgi:serine/threonine protein kinase